MKKLKPEEDTFGQEIWACYKGEEASEVVERDDGYFNATPGNPKNYFSEYEDWAPIERKAMELVKARVPAIEELDFKPNSFDTVIMMGSNFGLFGGLKTAKRILKKLHKITSESGLIIASTRDTFKTSIPEHLEYHKLNRQRGRMPGQLRLRIRFRKCVGRWFDYLIVSKKEMEEILKGTGWKIKETIDSDNSAYIAAFQKTYTCAHKQ